MTTLKLVKLKSHLNEMVDNGYIRPSVLPWGALVLFVKKKDRTFRLCIDYRNIEQDDEQEHVFIAEDQ